VLRAGLVLGLLAALVPGCDLFKPATPDAGSGETPLLPDYSSPANCLLYMKLGIEHKASGYAAYMGALGDTTDTSTSPRVGFHAFFDQVVWNDFKGFKPDDWDRAYEGQFFSAFVVLKAAAYEMTWGVDLDHSLDETSPDGNQMILHRHYLVRAMQEPPVTIAIGYADLYFTKVSGSRWALIRWEDRLDLDVPGGAHPQDEEQQTLGSRRLNTTGG
jgi:hypothetical protein